MPYGVVDWYDAGVGEGRILRSGRPYTVRESDLDPRCRIPGMRVHFDVDREHGDTAVNVTERRGGTRHRHRLGDRSGHRALDQSSGPASAGGPPPLGRDLERRPGRVAELWAALLGAGDLEHLTGLYAPHAVVRHAGRPAVGPGAIGAYWSTSDLLGVRPDSIDDHGDGTVAVRWPAGDDGVAPESRLTIAHGEIDDQWVGAGTRTTVRAGAGETTVSVSAVGAVRPEEWNAAVDEVESVLTTIDEPVLAARVRLERSTDPARERPCLATATIDVDGDPLRAHAAGADMIEAIHRLADRLRRRRHRVVDRRLALRHRGSEHPPGTWRHGDPPDVRSAVHPRPVADREIVRRKTFAPGEETVDEAILDLESLTESGGVVAGDVGSSTIFERVTTDDESIVMPKAPLPRLAYREIDVLRRWIEAGAPAFPDDVPQPAAAGKATSLAGWSRTWQQRRALLLARSSAPRLLSLQLRALSASRRAGARGWCRSPWAAASCRASSWRPSCG